MIVATNSNGFLVNSSSPDGEKVIAWFDKKDGLYYKLQTRTPEETRLITFGSESKLVESFPFRESWFLEGVKNKEIEEEIKRQLQ